MTAFQSAASKALVLSLLVSGASAATVGSHRASPSPYEENTKYEAGRKDAGISEKSSNRIGAVMDTLKEILSAVQTQERTDAKNYKCFKEWCGKELSEGNESLSDARDELAQTQTQVKSDDASATALAHENRNNADERSEISESLDQASNLRDDDHDKFTEDSTFNTQSISQIDKAIELVGAVHKQGGFLQGGRRVRAHVNEPGESSYVLGIMKGLKAKLETTKKEIEGAEAKKLGQYDEFTGTKTSQVKSLQADYAEKQIKLNEKKVSLAEGKNEIADLTDEVQETNVGLKDIARRCDKRTHEWLIKSEDRQNEKAALREAIQFIGQTVKESLLDVRARPLSTVAPVAVKASDVEDAAAALPDLDLGLAPEFLQTRVASRAEMERRHLHRPAPARTSHVSASALVQSADAQFTALIAGVQSHQRKEGFDGAVKVVRELIATLQREQTEEDDMKKYCKKELGAKEDNRVDALEKIDKVNATMQRKETEAEERKNSIEQIARLLEESAENLREAKELRTQERLAYDAGSKDRSLAVKVLAQAQNVLQSFYESKRRAALLEVDAEARRDTAPPPTEATTQGSGVQSQGAMLMLEKVADDIKKEQKDAGLEEADSKRGYKKFYEDGIATRDDREAERTEQTTRYAKALAKLAFAKEEMASLKKELENIEGELDALHEECDQLLENHEQRTKARDFEIAQLRDVVDILSGSSIAARTGGAAALLQSPTAAPRPLEAAVGAEDQDLLDMSRSIHGLELKARTLASLQ